MGKRNPTPAEERAFRDLARAAQRLREAQEQAEAQRQAERTERTTTNGGGRADG